MEIHDAVCSDMNYLRYSLLELNGEGRLFVGLRFQSAGLPCLTRMT